MEENIDIDFAVILDKIRACVKHDKKLNKKTKKFWSKKSKNIIVEAYYSYDKTEQTGKRAEVLIAAETTRQAVDMWKRYNNMVKIGSKSIKENSIPKGHKVLKAQMKSVLKNLPRETTYSKGYTLAAKTTIASLIRAGFPANEVSKYVTYGEERLRALVKQIFPMDIGCALSRTDIRRYTTVNISGKPRLDAKSVGHLCKAIEEGYSFLHVAGYFELEVVTTRLYYTNYKEVWELLHRFPHGYKISKQRKGL